MPTEFEIREFSMLLDFVHLQSNRILSKAHRMFGFEHPITESVRVANRNLVDAIAAVQDLMSDGDK